MRQKTKSLSLVACVVLVLLSTVAGTLAYFTDSDSAKNTFTIGKVGITLTETGTNGQNENHVEGKPRTGEGENGFEYILIPGLTYAKKPVVTVLKDSEDAYVRVLVTISNYDKMQDIFENKNEGKTVASEFFPDLNGDWMLTADSPRVTDNAATYEFRYKAVVNAKAATEEAEAEDKPLPPVFTYIHLPAEADNSQLAALAGLEVDIVAHAIQAAGFTATAEVTAENAAWAAFDTQRNPTPKPPQEEQQP